MKVIILFISVEDLIGNNINTLFNGMECIDYSFFRVTRDADLELKELEADDLLLAVEQSLQKRRLGGDVVRLEVESDMPNNILKVTYRKYFNTRRIYILLQKFIGLGRFKSADKN